MKVVIFCIGVYKLTDIIKFINENEERFSKFLDDKNVQQSDLNNDKTIDYSYAFIIDGIVSPSNPDIEFLNLLKKERFDFIEGSDKGLNYNQFVNYNSWILVNDSINTRYSSELAYSYFLADPTGRFFKKGVYELLNLRLYANFAIMALTKELLKALKLAKLLVSKENHEKTKLVFAAQWNQLKDKEFRYLTYSDPIGISHQDIVVSTIEIPLVLEIKEEAITPYVAKLIAKLSYIFNGHITPNEKITEHVQNALETA